jgi:hypothetical protein
MEITVLPRGDLDGDCAVNLIDLSKLANHWELTGPIADLDGNGHVGISDLAILTTRWLITD